VRDFSADFPLGIVRKGMSDPILSLRKRLVGEGGRFAKTWIKRDLGHMPDGPRGSRLKEMLREGGRTMRSDAESGILQTKLSLKRQEEDLATGRDELKSLSESST